jgi:hypothetical protein
MAFREVRVFEVREVPRPWLTGPSLRPIERMAAIDRKTVRRYIAAAVMAGANPDGGEDQLTRLSTEARRLPGTAGGITRSASGSAARLSLRAHPWRRCSERSAIRSRPL